MEIRFVKWKNHKNFIQNLGWIPINDLGFNDSYEEISTVGIVIYEDNTSIVLASATKEKECLNAIRLNKQDIIESTLLSNSGTDNIEINEIDEIKLIELYPNTSFTKLAKTFNTTTNKIGEMVTKLVNEGKLKRRLPLRNPQKAADAYRYAEEKNIDINIFIDLHKQGWSQSKLAKHFGLKASNISYLLRLLGDRVPSTNINIDIGKFVRLYPKSTITQLSHYFNTSRDTIRTIIKDLDKKGIINSKNKPRVQAKSRVFLKNINIKEFSKDYYNLSYSKLEDKYNICSSSISNLVKKLVDQGILSYKKGV